jgi:hypothetical protein
LIVTACWFTLGVRLTLVGFAVSTVPPAQVDVTVTFTGTEIEVFTD